MACRHDGGAMDRGLDLGFTGVSEDINFQRSENGLKIILLCKIFFECRWGILQSN